jgi:hypothetical protein
MSNLCYGVSFKNGEWGLIVARIIPSEKKRGKPKIVALDGKSKVDSDVWGWHDDKFAAIEGAARRIINASATLLRSRPPEFKWWFCRKHLNKLHRLGRKMLRAKGN